MTKEPISLNTTNVLTVAPDNAPRRRFLTPLPEPGHFLLVLDNSALEKWKRCAMAARNYLLLGREAHARNAALTFGGAVHVGLETLLRGRKEVGSIRELPDGQVTDAGCLEAEDAFLTRVVQSILRYFTENPTPPDEYRTPSCAIEVLAHYRQRASMPDYAWEILNDDVGPLIERAFEIPLGVVEVDAAIPESVIPDARVVGLNHMVYVSHIHVAWSGRIDVVARCGPGSAVRVVDHKTSSIDGDQFIQSFQLSSQTLGYVYAASQLWPTLDVVGFCLNVLRLRKPSAGQGLMDKGAHGGAPPLAFFRAYFDYMPERIAAWHRDTMLHISDLINCLVRNAWPLNDRHCMDKFGVCPYFSACRIDDEIARDRFLQGDAFKPVTWNPVAERV